MLTRYALICAVLLVAPLPSFAQTKKRVKAPSLNALQTEAERLFYAFEVPDHLSKVIRLLDQMAARSPHSPYVHWARARVAFWTKEAYYILESINSRVSYDREKLELAKQCHAHTSLCIQLAPKNAECHLLKGVCYSMQASTWGPSIKSIRVLKPMDRAWKEAIELPSNFQHFGEMSTRQLASVMRGVLYRLTPDSWWFWLFARIRGNKEKAYGWMVENVTGRLLKEPVTLIELGATAMCYGRDKKKPEKVKEGLDFLREGLKLKTRYALDDLDKRNMAYLLENPKEACSYRRERFEEISEKSVRTEITEAKSKK